MGRYQGRKMHFHRVVAYETRGKNTRGNPEFYLFTLDCGHQVHGFHSARASMIAFTLSVMIPDLLKEGKLSVNAFPRLHCHTCARGQPHAENATDVNKLVEDLMAKMKSVKGGA